VRRVAAQGVRIDRRDLQRVGFLPHRFSRWIDRRQGLRGVRSKGLGLEVGQLELVVEFEFEFEFIVRIGLLDKHRDQLERELTLHHEGTAMIKGFREFILRGNVIDLAVAVVIGAAFTGIVNTLVASFINPLIGLFFAADSLNEALALPVPTLGGGTVTFAFGTIIGAVINFLAVAVVVYFVFVMPMNRLKERAAAREQLPPEPEPMPSEAEILIQIRDLLQKQNDSAPPKP